MRTGAPFAVAWVGVSGSTGNSQPVLAIPAQEMIVKSISGEETEQGKDWTFSSCLLPQGTQGPSCSADRGPAARKLCRWVWQPLRAHWARTCLPLESGGGFAQAGNIGYLLVCSGSCWDFCCPSRQPTRDGQEGAGCRISLAGSPADCSASGWAATCRARHSRSFSALCPFCPGMYHL